MIAGVRQAGIVAGSGQAEVGQQCTFDALFQQDVRRLHVAMDQPLSMSGSEPGRCLHGDTQNFTQLQRSFPIDPLLQRFASDERHHQKRRFAVRLDIVDGHDVFMHHGCRRAGFAGKPFARAPLPAR